MEPDPDHLEVKSPDSGVPTEDLIALLYEELRRLAASRMAKERADHTLTATSLVHEVYMRLRTHQTRWSGKAQFFAAAAEAMRRALIDHARRTDSLKRGGGDRGLSLEWLDHAASAAGVGIEHLDQELEKLRRLDQEAHQVVMLRFFAGLCLADISMLLEINERTVKRRWQRARLWLLSRLGHELVVNSAEPKCEDEEER